jgi:hypothetical protein
MVASAIGDSDNYFILLPEMTVGGNGLRVLGLTVFYTRRNRGF